MAECSAKCLVCGSCAKLLRCGKCKQAYYCSKDHQIQHWSRHKGECKNMTLKCHLSSGAVEPRGSVKNNPTPHAGLSASSQCDVKFDIDDSNDDLMHDFRTNVGGVQKNSFEFDETRTQLPCKQDGVQETNACKAYSLSWLNSICDILVKDMNSHGICVIDNFLGHAKGDECLREVYELYGTGVFKAGTLIKRINESSENIRGDFITWVNGTEPNCENISNLMKILDAVIKKVNKQPDTGQLNNYELSKRTQAMISCYPGSGTHYVKHVDNPNDDGRCLTCIYYLNKSWNASRDGGMLRVFPSHENTVANIEPKFDRIIFFWSDRRNPHEVQPAFRTRFAITVWYMDSKDWKSENNEININKTNFSSQCL